MEPPAPAQSRLIALGLGAILLYVLNGLGSAKSTNHVGTSSNVYHQSSVTEIASAENVSIQHTADEEEVTCKFPQLDPWDKSIERFITHPRSFDCRRIQADDLAYLDEFGFLHLNRTARTLYETAYKEYVACVYAFIYRRHGTDDNALNNRTDYQFLLPDRPVAVPTEVAEVVCATLDKNTQEVLIRNAVYYNLYVHPANESAPKELVPTSDEQLSVLMFILESTSLSMLRRNLPKTFAYLTEKMGTHVFKGYTKVSDNSFHNLMAVITGKRTRSEQPDMPKEIMGQITSIQYDDWDLVWKHFAQKGYVTSFNEDKPDIGLFNHMSGGFARKPVHHYYRTFWTQLKRSFLDYRGSAFCFGNKPRVTYQLDILKRQVLKYRGLRQFIYTFFTELSHDTANDIERADELFTAFFHEMYTNGHFNHTVLVFMSDHGHRASDVRQTLVGLIEERLPAFTLTLPRWFPNKYPNITAQLLANQNKLTSNFDVHATLFDILNANYNGEQRSNHSRALSHFYPIPANRTCLEAGIPDMFCVCQQESAVSISSPVVTGAAQALVDHVNGLLKDHADKCMLLVYNATLHAEAVGVNKMVTDGVRKRKDAIKYENGYKDMRIRDGDIRKLRVAVEVTPSGATLEGLVSVINATGGEYSVTDNISRTNRYGAQSACLQHQLELRKFCYCKDYHQTSKAAAADA